MNDIETLHPPRKIMLATDLSCRCDRALDRAVELAQRWNATLVIAHVVEPNGMDDDISAPALPSWRRGIDPLERARQQIRRELGVDSANIEIRVDEGQPAPQLLDIAQREGCDLIITGMARDEPFGRMLLGTTVNQLVRRSSVPLLVVKRRAVRPYRQIVVATDFSESSRHALMTAVGCFPDAAFTLFHGYDVPFASFLDKRGLRDQVSALEKECGEEFLSATPLDEKRRRHIPTLIEHGIPERLLSNYVRDRRADLTVIGSHGRTALFDVLIGSMTQRLLEAVAGDILVVIDPRARKWA